MSLNYWVASGPFGGRANQEGDNRLLRVMSEGKDQNGWGVRLTAKTIAGPFSNEDRAREVMSVIIIACPEYRTDDRGELPTRELTEEDISTTRRMMKLPPVQRETLLSRGEIDNE